MLPAFFEAKKWNFMKAVGSAFLRWMLIHLMRKIVAESFHSKRKWTLGKDSCFSDHNPLSGSFHFSFFVFWWKWPKTKKSAVLFVYFLYKKSSFCLKMTADFFAFGHFDQKNKKQKMKRTRHLLQCAQISTHILIELLNICWSLHVIPNFKSKNLIHHWTDQNGVSMQILKKLWFQILELGKTTKKQMATESIQKSAQIVTRILIRKIGCLCLILASLWMIMFAL